MKKKPDGSVEVILKTPIQWADGVVYEKLVFKKPKAKHLKGLRFDRFGADEVLALASKLCGEPPPLLDELDVEDFMVVAEVMGDFLPSGVQGGSQLSQP